MSMTDQELFDTVVAHLLTQSKPARDLNGNCLYRGPDGTKCAVGCLIPDELYDPVIEGQPVEDLGDFIVPPWKPKQEPLLQDLQDAHDETENWDDIPGVLADIARKHGLEFKSCPAS